MNSSNLKEAGSLAVAFGLKAVIYGPAGTGKTPLINTAPRPLLLACEPGLLSMRGSKVPTYQAFDVKSIEEFFLWFFNSAEVKNFDTLAIDSTSQMADIYLQDAKKNNRHGLQAYGEMAEKCMLHWRRLYFWPNKHTYLIAKEEIVDMNGYTFRRPYYPGKVLPVDMPHLFDAILHLKKYPIPGVGETLAFRCQGDTGVLARNRTGNLNEYEPPDFGALVHKAMS